MERVEQSEHSFTVSEVVLNEIARTPDGRRRERLEKLVSLAHAIIAMNDQIHRRGAKLQQQSFKPFDALHVASAEAARVDCLCTADDRLIQKAMQADLKVRVVSILELFQELQL